MTEQITLTRPDDWHVHLRDSELTAAVIRDTARQFARVCAMPNLQPPLTTVDAALAYQNRLCRQSPQGFTPFVSLYLTENTSLDEVIRVAKTPEILAFKLYPAGATTHSDAGVRSVKNCYRLFSQMEKLGVVLQIHGEVVDPEVDIFDREARFIETAMLPLLKNFPKLRVVFEHITTREAVDCVRAHAVVDALPRIAATITPQHLRFNRNALLVGGIRPHNYCLPVLKRETHRLALVDAAVSGEASFFLGSDSAPHLQSAKEASCGCAGCYTALHALPIYAQVFEDAGKLHRLDDFASRFGAEFYGVPPNTEKITLEKKSWTVPSHTDDLALIPLLAGEKLSWQLVTM